MPPDIDGEASSADVTAREGAGVALRCLASGSPAPALTWRREDAAHFTLDGKVMGSFILKYLFLLIFPSIFEFYVFMLFLPSFNCVEIARLYNSRVFSAFYNKGK